MKKLVPYICTLVYGVFGGLLVESIIRLLSIIVSPFSDSSLRSYLILCIIASIFSVLVIAITVIINSAYLINLNDKHKVKITIIFEILAGIPLFLICWSLL